MRIRTRFIVSIVLFSIVVAAIAVSVGLTLEQLNQIDRQEAIVSSIARGASELTYQSDDYLFNRNVRQLERWRAKWDVVSKALVAIEPMNAEERAIVTQLEGDLRRQKAIFEDITRVLGASAEPPATSASDDLVRVSWSRMAVQGQSLTFHAQRLIEVIEDRHNEVQGRNTLLVGVLLAILAAYLFLNYLVVYRNWLSSLGELQRGTEVVGSGNLDFTIRVRGKGEVGDLARAFNRMTSDLRGAVASKAELEHEVSERMEAEAALSESLARTTLLKDLASAAALSLDSTKLSERVLAIATVYVGADVGAVYLIDERDHPARLVAAVGDIEGPFDEEIALDETTLGGRAIVTGRMEVEGEEPPSEAPSNRHEATISLDRRRLALPISGRTDVIGTITLGFPGSRSFTADEIDLYEAVGNVLGIGLENVRLYETQRDIADRLQEALLSLPDTVGGIEFAHLYRSATEAARVGGDFYDLFELSHGLLGITVGDVAGKGLDAAVLTSLAKNTIRAHANEKGKTPAEILKLTNDVVYRSTVTEAFVTVFFGLLDRRDGRLVYANAGHTATAVVGADGNVKPLAATGPILGAFADMKFEQGEICLALEELLFLYTDGLTEARRDGELYGEARLFDFLGAANGRRADELIGNVLADVLHFSGNMLRDDLAIMAIRRVEEAD